MKLQGIDMKHARIASTIGIELMLLRRRGRTECKHGLSVIAR